VPELSRSAAGGLFSLAARLFSLAARLVPLALLWAGCDGDRPTSHQAAPFAANPPIAGVNLDVSRSLPEATLDDLVATGVGWVALIPFGWQPRWDVPEVRLRTTGVRWGETDEGLRQIVERAQARGLRTLLKPHIWLIDEVPGQWRGTIGFDSDEDWQAWEADYRALVLHYAALAAETGVDMVSIGIELHRATSERPDFWRALIDDVRRVYDGPLTYGANWDGEATAIQFWDRLDYIGVHAYFPVTSRLDASVGQIERGWGPHVRLLDALCARWQRPILFTEVGYRSIAGAGVQPWNYGVRAAADAQEQADLYEGLFRAFWERDWFAGVFLWEWDADLRADSDLTQDDDYTPQGKPAMEVLRRWYGGDA
jgi:hypothetical protein